MDLQRKVLGLPVVNNVNEGFQAIDDEQFSGHKQVKREFEAKHGKLSHEEQIELLHKIFDLYGKGQMDEGIALFRQKFLFWWVAGKRGGDSP